MISICQGETEVPEETGAASFRDRYDLHEARSAVFAIALFRPPRSGSCESIASKIEISGFEFEKWVYGEWICEGSRPSACPRPRRRSWVELLSRGLGLIKLTHALHLYIRLVAPPRTTNGPAIAVPSLLEFRRVVLDPPQNCRVRQNNPAFPHHRHQIAIA